MKVSMIAPVYKIKEDILRKSIECMIKQDFNKDDYEIILVDDGSPDNSGNICDYYSKKNNNIKVIHTINGGVSKARNIGIKESVGKYLCFVDPDDFIKPNFIFELYNKITKYNAELAMCDFNYGNQKKETDNKITLYDSEEKINKIASIFIGGEQFPNITITGAPWAKIYLKKIIVDNKCYFDESLPRSQDNEFNFRYIQYVTKCVYINKKLYNYTINESSAMRRFWPNAIENANILLNKIEKDINQRRQKELYNLAFQAFVFGKIEDLLYTFFVHRDNQKKIKYKLNLMKETFYKGYYKECIYNYNYTGKSIYRKILLFFLKKKSVLGAYLCAWLRLKLKTRK